MTNLEVVNLITSEAIIAAESENGAIGADFDIAFDLVPVAHMVCIFLCEAASRKLIVVLLDAIVLGKRLRLVSKVDARLGVALDLVFLDFRVRATAARDTASLVVFDGVAADERSGVKHDNSVSVIDNIIAHDPREATFNDEDALGTTLPDLVPNHDGVSTGRPAKRQIRLVVLRDFVSLYVCVG